MSQTFKLYRLQLIDTQLDQVKARMDEIDAILKDNRALKQAVAQDEVARSRVDAANKALKKTEADVSAQRIKIEQTESSLYGGKIRNPKELQGLQDEAGALKRYLAILEDRQLEAMITAEQAEDELKIAEQNLTAVKANVAEQHANLLTEKRTLAQDLSRLENEHLAAAASIPPEALVIYEKLRKNRRGSAVVKVADKACSACGSVLNARLLQAARSPNKIACCDTCGRILYSG